MCDPTNSAPLNTTPTESQPIDPAELSLRDELAEPLEAPLVISDAPLAPPREEPAPGEPAPDEPAPDELLSAPDELPSASEAAQSVDADEAARDVPDQGLAAALAEDDWLASCEQRIRQPFHDRLLLRSALTHASGAPHRLASNERLEFLGDAILGLVVCETLFRRFPQYLEGELTRIKSVVVSRDTCARVGRQLGLEDFLRVGKGLASFRYPDSLMADVIEALVAAIYLDAGDAAVREFIHRNFMSELELAVAGDVGENHKSVLQQLAQREFGSTPAYHLVSESGPDHDKCFQIAAGICGRKFGPAWGRSKKEAEQQAAANALRELREDRARRAAPETTATADAQELDERPAPDSSEHSKNDNNLSPDIDDSLADESEW